MWTHAVYGTDLYHFIQWFILYSFMGWVVESIYMSFCNRKLTNRGFAFSPFCPIYAPCQPDSRTGQAGSAVAQI